MVTYSPTVEISDEILRPWGIEFHFQVVVEQKVEITDGVYIPTGRWASSQGMWFGVLQ